MFGFLYVIPTYIPDITVSTKKLFEKGMESIPSEAVCYPAKLVHGHIADLLEKGIDFIFYPCMSYNLEEPDTDNHYNCPVVAYYPELLKANVPELDEKNFKSYRPALPCCITFACKH